MALPTLLFYIGDTLDGIINLRTTDASTGATSPFVIEAGSVVEVLFPPADPLLPVVLSTANPGEISIIDANLATILISGPASKSLLMKEGKKQSLDCVVTQGVSGKIQTFQYTGLVTVAKRANPE